MKINKLAIAHTTAAVVLACAASAAHAQYSGLNFFGDSLTDSGAYTNFVGGNAAVARFTTNPGTVWSENLGARYGLAVRSGWAFAGTVATPIFVPTGGNNYAVGGARVSQQPGVLPGFPTVEAVIPTITTQVSTFLGQSGGAVSRGALYGVWAGANDVFFQAGAIGQGLPSTTALANVATAAAQNVVQINRLRGAGAEAIVVIGLPDMGKTPAGAAQGAVGAAGLTSLSDAYNSNQATQLKVSGATNVLYLDPRSLFNEILANPARYGISNVTTPACGTASALGCVAPAGTSAFLFADGVHPSATAHRIIGDWVYSALSGAAAVSRLAEIPAGRLGAQWRAIDDRVRNYAVTGGKSGLYFNGDYAPARIDGNITSASIKGAGTTGTIGYDLSFGPGLIGVALGLADHNYNLGGAGGRVEYQELIASLYGAAKFGQAYLDGGFSIARHAYDVRRNSVLGPFTTSDTGETKANQWGFRIGGGYKFTAGGVVHGPVAGLSWEKILVDSYSESASPTAMTFGKQTRNSLKHRIGYQVVGDLPSAFARIKPYARLTHEKEYENNGNALTAGIAGSGFALSTATRTTKDNWGLVNVGASLDFKSVIANIGYSSTFSQTGARSSSVNLGVAVPF